jgi:high-affinity Fe2+/Pb2+ permease
MMISVREALELILIVMAIIALVVWVVRNAR